MKKTIKNPARTKARNSQKATPVTVTVTAAINSHETNYLVYTNGTVALNFGKPSDPELTLIAISTANQSRSPLSTSHF